MYLALVVEHLGVHLQVLDLPDHVVELAEAELRHVLADLLRHPTQTQKYWDIFGGGLVQSGRYW